MNFIKTSEHLFVWNDENIVTTLCNYNVNLYDDTLFSYYGISSPVHISNSVTKRKSEFLAGRYACKLCLDKIGSPTNSVSVGSNREPKWPTGYVGSITHSAKIAVAAVAESSKHIYIGIDIEPIMTKAIAQKISGLIVKSDERKFLQQSFNFELALTIIFSAKESLYKALYSMRKEFLDFHDAKLLSFDVINSNCTFKLRRDVFFKDSRVYIVRFMIVNQEVFTYLSINTTARSL